MTHKEHSVKIDLTQAETVDTQYNHVKVVNFGRRSKTETVSVNRCELGHAVPTCSMTQAKKVNSIHYTLILINKEHALKSVDSFHCTVDEN